MNKQEYKQLSHAIRTDNRKYARLETSYHALCSPRAEMHNTLLWCDNYKCDKYGRSFYKYSCIGDYDIGLVWEYRKI